MTFDARIFIHGVANFIPHKEGDKLLVLFPDQEEALQRGMKTPGERELCRHYAVVQMDSRCLDPELPRLWLTLDIDKHWLSIESDSTVPMNLSDEEPISGLLRLGEILEKVQLGAFTELDERALPGPGFDPSLVKGGLYLDAGILGAESKYQGAFTFRTVGGGSLGLTHDMSSVIRVELGQVSDLRLTTRPLTGGEPSTFPLQPVGDELHLWVRHFCDLREPDPEREVPTVGKLDDDFILNYALQRDLPHLLESNAHLLPLPEVPASWVKGGPIGGDPHECMPARQGSQSFNKPTKS